MNQNQNQSQNQNLNSGGQGQTISNPKTTQLQKTPQMNDRDFLNDVLATEKYLTTAYSTALNEASHDALYQDILSVFTETQNEQRQLYNLMFKKGWYKLEQEDQQKLQQKYQQFQNYTTTQFPYNNGQLQ